MLVEQGLDLIEPAADFEFRSRYGGSEAHKLIVALNITIVGGKDIRSH